MVISLNPSLDALRLDGHIVDVHFGVFTPDIVYESTLLSGASDKTLTLSVDTGTGDITDCLSGYTVRLFSSAGVFKGATNIRAGAVGSAGSLPIRELGASDIQTISGDIVRVYNLPFLGDKLPRDNETFAPDNVTYSNQGEDYPPNVISGGHFMGFTDVGETFATVQMTGTGSDVTDPTSTPGNVTHLWELLTSTLAFQSGGADSDADPVIEANVGYGLAKHTVTDTDNSATWYQYVCFQVYDRSDPDVVPGYPLISCTLNGEVVQGWSGDIELQGAISKSDVPDGSLCAVWTQEYVRYAVSASYYSTIDYAGTGGLYASRAHIKFIGYMVRDEGDVTSPDAPSYRTRFNLRSPLAQLATLPGWTKVFTRTASPTDWTGMKGLTVSLAIWHLLRHYGWYSNIYDVIIDADFLDQDFSQFFLDKLTADAQIRELADGQDARVVNLRTGELLIHTDPDYIPIGDRTGITTLVTLTDADVLAGSTYSRDHWKVLQTFELRAFQGGAVQNNVYYSRFPGGTPGRGAQVTVAEKVIADDQLDANERCGRRAAKIDGTVMTTLTGNYERAIEWNVPLRGYYDGLDFHKAYCKTTLVATSNGRAINLSDHLFSLTRISVTYNANGASEVQATLKSATNAYWGATYIPPVSELPPYTPPDFITPPYFPPSNPSRLPPWNGIDQTPVKMALLAANTNKAFIASSWNATATTQSWTEVSTGLVGDGLWWTADPYDYRRFFALTTNGLYRNDNFPGGGSWSQIASNTAMFGGGSYIGHNIIMSINRRGWIMVATGIQTVAVSFNYGASWSLVAVDGGTPTPVTALSRFSVKIAASSNNSTASGVVYASVGSGFSATDTLFKTTNWGTTWSLANADTAGVTTSTPVISVPHVRLNGDANINDSNQELYYVEGSGNQGAVRFSNTAGTSWTSKFTINAGGSVIRVDGCEAGYNLMPFTHDSNILIYSTQFGMAYSSDAGLTRDFASNVLSGASPSEWQCGVNGFGLHIGAMLGWNRGGTTGGLWWSLDAGATGVQCTLPSGVTLVANSQWLLDTFIAPG